MTIFSGWRRREERKCQERSQKRGQRVGPEGNGQASCGSGHQGEQRERGHQEHQSRAQVSSGLVKKKEMRLEVFFFFFFFFEGLCFTNKLYQVYQEHQSRAQVSWGLIKKRKDATWSFFFFFFEGLCFTKKKFIWKTSLLCFNFRIGNEIWNL